MILRYSSSEMKALIKQNRNKIETKLHLEFETACQNKFSKKVHPGW